MNQQHKIKGLLLIIFLIMFLWVMVSYAEVPCQPIQLNYQHQLLTLRLDHSMAHAASSTIPFTNAMASTEERSSWVPRIVVPVLAVAVIGTSIYLLYSQRG